MADDKEESVEINADETHDGSCSDSDTGDVYTEEKEETPKTFKELVRLLCTAQRGEYLLASQPTELVLILPTTTTTTSSAVEIISTVF